ncbi:MAG: IS110 family transposase [Deltaproteobacteria bacterium]|jgi:transposase|nr:IS110 family transposase [Deltaproteobacteria bacterium]
MHKEFSTLPHGLRALAYWAISKGARRVIMESSGVYWKTLHAALVKVGLKVIVVNPRHAKNLPGR